MKNVQKIDLGLTGYDELFMNDAERKENKLPRIYDVPISEIDDFPDHPFKVKIDEDIVNTVKKSVFRKMKNGSKSTRKNCADLRRPPPRSRTRQEIPRRSMSRRKERIPASSVIRRSKQRSVPNTPLSSLPVLRVNRL